MYLKLFIFTLIFIITFTSCSGPNKVTNIDKQETEHTILFGDYSGRYLVFDVTGGNTNLILLEVDISLSFTDETYELEDTTATICSPSGKYVISDDFVILSEVYFGNATTVCDPFYNPEDTFSILRTTDSLILMQSIGNTQKEFRLIKNL